MKLSQIKSNAHYDMVHGKPLVLERDNDGTSIYRFNIESETSIPEGEDEEVQIGWKCYEIRIWNEPTKANLKKAIIRSFIDETAEFDLVNSYNKHVLGIVTNEDAVVKYKEYLQFTEDLDVMLLKDLSNQM